MKPKLKFEHRFPLTVLMWTLPVTALAVSLVCLEQFPQGLKWSAVVVIGCLWLAAALVLAGAASDGAICHERGDIIFAGPEIEGVPVAEGEHDCVCFVAAEAPPVKSAGPFGRVLQLMTGG